MPLPSPLLFSWTFSLLECLLRHPGHALSRDSTLPPGISRWLGQDVPSRLRGAVPVEISVVYEQEKAASSG